MTDLALGAKCGCRGASALAGSRGKQTLLVQHSGEGEQTEAAAGLPEELTA